MFGFDENVRLVLRVFDVAGYFNRMDAGGFAQAFSRFGGVLLAARCSFGHVFELDAADDRLHFQYAPVDTEAFVQSTETGCVFVAVHDVIVFTMVFVRPRSVPQLLVTSGYHAAFIADGHDLVLVKRSCVNMADRTDGFVLVPRAMYLGVVFDNPQIMFSGQGHDVVHFGRHTSQVNHNDGFCV